MEKGIVLFMNIQRIHCFLAVSEHLNFTKAAKSLNIAQTAISRQIAVLEDELGVILFERSNREVKLTLAGNIFYQKMKYILKEYDSAVKLTKETYENSKVINIGIGQYEKKLVINYINKFLEKNPKAHINISQYLYKDLLENLKNKTVDIIFSSAIPKEYIENENIIFNKLSRGKVKVVMRKNHFLATKDDFAIRDLSGETIITIGEEPGPCSITALQDMLLKEQVDSKIVRANSLDALLLMVESGEGVAFVPEYFEKDLSESLVMKGDTIYSKSDFACMILQKNNNKEINAFMDLVLNMAN